MISTWSPGCLTELSLPPCHPITVTFLLLLIFRRSYPLALNHIWFLCVQGILSATWLWSFLPSAGPSRRIVTASSSATSYPSSDSQVRKLEKQLRLHTLVTRLKPTLLLFTFSDCLQLHNFIYQCPHIILHTCENVFTFHWSECLVGLCLISCWCWVLVLPHDAAVWDAGGPQCYSQI